MLEEKKSILKRTIVVIFLVVFLVMSGMDIYAQKVGTDLKDSVVRLHIIANSDTYEDQQVKLKVRDRIVQETGSLFKNQDYAESKEEIETHLSLFEVIANDELQKNGFEPNAKAYFGTFYFPTKTYKDVSFPAGDYTALRIVIGEGKGQNWWCVLFPPLCFVGVEEPYMEEQSKDELKQIMSEDEYELISKSDEELPVKFKFKIVELIQEAKNKLVSENK